MTPTRRGSIVTFYSFKGGVGRTFILVNVAALLARWGWRILLVDLDLEAPGLDRYVRNYLPTETSDGFVELVHAVRRGEPADWRSVRQKVDFGFEGGVDLIRAGREDQGFRERLGELNWRELYDTHGLGRVIERWRLEWRGEYDLVLVDSRTGWADLQGITTVQLPDILVALFTGNDQSFEGVMRVAREARGRLRRSLPTAPGELPVIPVITRFDLAAGEVAREWEQRLAHRLPELLDWAGETTSMEPLLAALRIGYHPAFAFGEGVPAVTERLAETGSPMETGSFVSEIAPLAALLARGLDGVGLVAADRSALFEGAKKPAAGEAATTPERPPVMVLATPDARGLADEVARGLRDAGVRVLGEPSGGGVGAAAMLADVPGAHVVVVAGATIPRSLRLELAALRELQVDEPERRLLFMPVASMAEPAGFTRVGSSPSSVPTALGYADAPPTDPIESWRAYVRQRHARLVPFFPGASEKVLTDVFVELDLEWERAEGKHPRMELLEGFGRPGESLTLRQLAAVKPHAAILGDPGAGKTTLLRHLAYSLAGESGSPSPVFLSLARLDGAWADPYDLAEAELRQGDPTAPPGLASALRKARAWVLLDGVDEVDLRRMEVIREGIHAFARKHPKTVVLVTSRRVGRDVGGIPQGFSVAEVKKLDPRRQRLLLDRLLGEERAAPVMGEIERRGALAELAGSPLMLTLLAVVAREVGARGEGLPTRPVRLYAAAIDLLLRRGFAVAPAGVRDPELARRLLRRLSLTLQEEGGEAWPREVLSEKLLAERDAEADLRRRVLDTWRSHAELVDDLGTNGGVVGPHDGAGVPWRYLHRSLREYLAAEQLQSEGPERVARFVKGWTDAEERKRKAERERKPDPGAPDPARWGEVHGLLCALVEDPFGPLGDLRRINPDLCRRVQLGVEAPVERLLEFVLQDGDWEEDTLHTLVERAGPELVPHLQARVKPDAGTRLLGAVGYLLDRLGAFDARSFFARCRPGIAPPRIDTVDIPAGSFWMGSPEGVGPDYERPRHRVTLPRPFRLGRTTVRADEWQVFSGSDRPRSARLPATGMTWYEAWLFCRWVGGELPTEAEWEYACRGGTDTRWSHGDDESKLPEYAWFDKNGGSKVHDVATRKPNPWGLYDMHGNVWEWCRDDLRGYTATAVTDPLGPESPVGAPGGRAFRGGTYWDGADGCRSAYRDWIHPGYRDVFLGFRVRLPPP